MVYSYLFFISSSYAQNFVTPSLRKYIINFIAWAFIAIISMASCNDIIAGSISTIGTVTRSLFGVDRLSYIPLNGVQCTGSEERLLDCTRSRLHCDRYYFSRGDAGVRCHIRTGNERRGEIK